MRKRSVGLKQKLREGSEFKGKEKEIPNPTRLGKGKEGKEGKTRREGEKCRKELQSKNAQRILKNTAKGRGCEGGGR